MPTTSNESEAIEPTETPLETPAAPEPDLAAQMAAFRTERDAERAERQQDREATQSTLQMLREGFTALAASQQRPTDQLPQDVSDDFIEQALAEGKGAQAIRQALKAEVARATADLKRNTVDPLANLVTTHGLDAIAALALEAASVGVSEVMKPYVARYRPEIDQAIQGMTPELRLKVANIKHAQAIILGHHLPEIIEEERQKVIRQYRENPSSLPGTAVSRQGRGTEPGTPTAEELFGKNSPEARMIREAGGEDAFIARHQKSPHASKSWGEYVSRHQAMQGREPEGTA